MPQHPSPQRALGVSLLAPVPLAAMWLGTSFVGMTPPDRLASHRYFHLLAMALLFGLISALRCAHGRTSANLWLGGAGHGDRMIRSL